MTKKEFSKYAEDTIRDLYAMAKEITPDLETICLRLAVTDDYESFTVDTFNFPTEEVNYLLQGSHFISKLDNGGQINKEEVA